MDDGSASVFCFTPLRVPVSELGRLAACPPSQPSPAAPVCSAPPLPQGPCPVCPRLDQEFEPFRQAAYWKAQHARALDREAQLKAEIQRLEAMVRLREQQLFGRKTETAAATAPAAPDAPAPIRRHVGRAASNPGGQVRSDAITPTFRQSRNSSPSTGEVPLLAVWSAVRRLPRHRGFHHPGGRGPGPSPGHSPPPLPPHLLVRRSFRHRHGPAAAPADSQEHPGSLDLGDDPLGQVSVLPSDLSAVGRLGHARPGPVVGHDHRRPEAIWCLCSSRCTKRW